MEKINNDNKIIEIKNTFYKSPPQSVRIEGLSLIVEIWQLFDKYEALKTNNIQYNKQMGKFQQVANKLSVFKQDMGERKYDDKIYELIAHTIPESGLEADLENIEDGLGGDDVLPYYGLVPRTNLYLSDIKNPLGGLSYLWSCSGFTEKNQIIVNYCIQIIIDIINCMKFSADKLDYYKKYYGKGKNISIGGCADYLGVVCANSYELMFIGAIGQAEGNVHIFSQIRRLLSCLIIYQTPLEGSKYSSRYFTGEQTQQYYLNKYPGLQQQFDDPLEYFSPFNIDVLVFILFANVPNTVKYHQLLEIRAGLKKAFELQQTYAIELMGDISGECQTGTILNTPRFLDYVKKSHQYRSPTCGQQDMETKYGEDIKGTKIRGEQDVIFQQICSIYMKILEHPFVLLEEIYHQARHKRAEVLNGEKYEDIDIYMELTKLG